MRRTNPVTLIAVLVAVVVVLAGAGLAAPALFIDRHDGDVMHLLDMVFRMAEGQMPHADFVTPLGILSIWPIAALIQAGFGAGQAVIVAQAALAALLILPTWWVAWTRFPAAGALAFGGSVMVLCLAMIYGDTGLHLSMSMHYNRWGWALAFLALAIGFLPPRGDTSMSVDALILGLVMAVLTLLKITFTIAFAGPIIAMMLLRRDFGRLAVSILVAAAALGAAALVLGPGFFVAYAADLVDTATSDLRSYPGLEPLDLAAVPAYVVGTILALAAVMVLRTGGRPAEGLGLLLLIPACIYVTAQNFGNDPKWMWLVGLIVLALRPEAGRSAIGGFEARTALNVIGAGLVLAALPSLVNMAASPFRNLAEDPGEYIAMLPNRAGHDDLQVYVVQALRHDVIRPADGPSSGLAWAREAADRDAPVTLLGEALEVCFQRSGFQGWARSIAADLVAAGYDQGQQIFNADLLNVYWLLEPSLAPLEGAAPWIYDGLPGWEAASHVLVPHCPLQAPVRTYFVEQITALLEAGTASLTEVRRTPLYTLYEKRDL